VEGPNAIGEAIDAGARIIEIVCDASARLPASFDAKLRGLYESGVAVTDISPRDFAAVADTETPQGVLAVVASPERALPEVLADVARVGFGLIGVEVRDPGNVGTLIRSVEASGAGGLVLCNGCADATSPKVVRSSAGALFHVPIAIDAGEPSAVFDAARELGIRVLGTSAASGTPHPGPECVSLDDLDVSPGGQPVVFVMSNEAHGLPDELAAQLDGFVAIPMAGRTESLNVAMAATVLVFETARRRRLPVTE
jgi:RNA methyltransferase, TrmH family